LDHVALEVAFEIQYVKRKPELFSHTTRIVNIVKRTATRRQRITVFISVDATSLIPQLHREADQLVTLLFENRRGRGRIHATTHCYCYLHYLYLYTEC
jgi:hypothetical protein